MSFLVLAQQKIRTPEISAYLNFETSIARFHAINRGGVITRGFIGTMIVAGIVYIGILYSLFSVGFQIQAASASLPELTDDVQNLELKLQARQFGFGSQNMDRLGSMEKVVSVKYLTSETISVSSL